MPNAETNQKQHGTLASEAAPRAFSLLDQSPSEGDVSSIDEIGFFLEKKPAEIVVSHYSYSDFAVVDTVDLREGWPFLGKSHDGFRSLVNTGTENALVTGLHPARVR